MEIASLPLTQSYFPWHFAPKSYLDILINNDMDKSETK